MMYNWENATSHERKDPAAQGAQPGQPDMGGIELGIAQINLRARDYETMRTFYTLALGIKPIKAHASEDPAIRACRFDLSAVSILLSELPEADRSVGHGAQELVFSAGGNEGVDAAYDRLRNVPGCKPVQFPHYASDNRYETILEDPEGNALIFRD